MTFEVTYLQDALDFWDTDKKALIVATNGFIKKTKKTPKLEIQKAENLREQYFKENCGQK